MTTAARWSLDFLISQLAGDEELARQMVRLFIDESPAMLAAIHAAFATGDPDAVRRAAHALKGAAGNFTPDGLPQTARLLEQCAADGHLDQAAALLDQLEQDLGDLLGAMGQVA